MAFRTRYWVMYRKSKYRGSTTWKRYFPTLKALQTWRDNHPNGRNYTEIDSHA